MYTQLLGSALNQRRPADIGPTTADALAELFRCRRRLLVRTGASRQPGHGLGVVTDHLAYDVALVRLARSIAIDCDPSRFDQPQHERQTVERALVARGVPLDDLGDLGERSHAS
jgi:hypothetical protein